ncbi:MAG: hypothetical protein ACMXYE_02840 [Candidatus Woesearchaeota archaeon]
MEPANHDLMTEFDFKQPHQIEVGKDQIMEVNWPQPTKYYRLIHESWNSSIEEPYFWLLNYMRYDLGFSIIHKVTDVFSASEQSSFFGLGQQRLGMQQDKVSSFLAVIGKMTKELFQVVREMRIIDERLSFYVSSEKREKNVFAVKDINPENRAWESAEITLKGYWVDLVEQGTKNPASVYGMAREVQFTTLPDLFFSIHPYNEEMVDKAVDHPDFQKAFNRKVREVLKRKLRTYLTWKKQTKQELIDKRGFTLRYMYQHVHIIRLYMSYVKPYLKNIQRLQFDENRARSPDLISAFENSVVEVEIMGQFLPKGNKNVWAVVNLHFLFKTKPSLNYHAEGYNRGPIHEGIAEITYRDYAWTQEQIDKYLRMRDKEDFELLKVIDKNLEFAMQELGDDLFRYLDEAEKQMKSKFGAKDYTPYHETLGIKKHEAKVTEEAKKNSPKQSSNPFAAAFDGFKEIGSAFRLSSGKKSDSDKNNNNKKLSKADVLKKKAEEGAAKKDASARSWLLYKNYKKAHKMIAW